MDGNCKCRKISDSTTELRLKPSEFPNTLGCACVKFLKVSPQSNPRSSESNDIFTPDVCKIFKPLS